MVLPLFLLFQYFSYQLESKHQIIIINVSNYKKFGLPFVRDSWEHELDKIIENDETKIFWDFCLQTDCKHLEHNNSDITAEEGKKWNRVWNIYTPIPGESRIEKKEEVKTTKYQE